MNDFSINWIWVIGLISEFDYRVMELCFDQSDAVLSAESIITGDHITIMIVDEGKAIVVHYDADMERFDEMENVLYRHFANL